MLDFFTRCFSFYDYEHLQNSHFPRDHREHQVSPVVKSHDIISTLMLTADADVQNKNTVGKIRNKKIRAGVAEAYEPKCLLLDNNV